MVVRAAQSSAKTVAVMTVGNAVKLLVRQVMPILMRRPRAGRQDTSKTETIFVTTAHAESSINVKKIHVLVIPPVQVMAAWTTGIIATPAVQKSIPNVLTAVKTVISNGAQRR